MTFEASPTSSQEQKHRRIRWLYRRHRPEARWTERNKLILDGEQGEEQQRVVKDEFIRLYGRPPEGLELAHILKSVWTEARELAGWRYCFNAQCYFRADGSRVRYDDGSEWRHL